MAAPVSPVNLQKAVTLFAYQLETSAFPPSSPDLAIQYAKLLRLIALSAWRPDTPPATGAAAASAAITAAATTLGVADPTQAALPSITAVALAAVSAAANLPTATAALAALVARVGDARTALVDNVVSAIAGGPERRCVMLLGARAGGAVEEAAREAAADMDRLDVVVVAAGVGAAEAMATRLRACDGVGDVRIVGLEGIVECLRDVRVHGVLVDAVAVGGDGVVVDGGAAVMVAAARVAGVRVFACAADFDVLPGGGDGEACIPALRAARGHPGRVMCYEDVVRSGARIRIVNPLWDFVRGDGFDVLVTSGGAIAAGRLGKLEGLGEAIAV